MISQNNYYLVVIILLFFSFACTRRAYHQRPVQRISITTNKNVKVISVAGKAPLQILHTAPLSRDELQTLNSKQLLVAAKKLYKAERKRGKQTTVYSVVRDTAPLAITVGADSIQKTIYLNARRNYGLFFNMKYVFGPKDSMNTFKHWIYPKENFISLADNSVRISRLAPLNKGNVRVTLSPGVQLFNLTTDSGHRSSAGIIGFEMSVDYFYHENRFLSFAIGAGTDKVALPIDYFGSGYINTGSTVYTSVRDNIIKGKFDVGYGLSLSRLYWTATPINDTSLPERRISTTGLGLSFSAHYQLRQNLRFGMVYQPNLININQNFAFAYQHYMAIQLTWSIPKHREKF